MALFLGDSNIIPRAIKAKNAKTLERKIHALQLKKGMEYKFISFYHDGENHVGWYYILLSENEQINELIGERNESTTE